MIDDETSAKIRQLYYGNHYTVYAITKSLGCHHSTIKRVITSSGDNLKIPKSSKSILAPYKQNILENIELYPRLPATRLIQILRDRGFEGSVVTLRKYIREHHVRKRVKAYIKMTVHPGEQAQVDWAHAGTLKVGSATRKLYIFVMVLSYSRAIYAEFTFNMHTSTFLRCHERAFAYFGGIARILLYDNLKSVVLQRRGKEVRFNSDILEFSSFYAFEPRPCNVRRGNEKGRVERSIRYIRDNFLSARNLSDLKSANEAILKWCTNIANKRPWPEDRQYLVLSMWQKEKNNLMVLGDHKINPTEQVSVIARKTPLVNFDLNSYSVPPSFVEKNLLISASDHSVKIYNNTTLIVSHKRSYDRNKYIEDKLHRPKLSKHRSFGRTNCMRESILKDFPQLEVMLSKQFSEGHDIATIVRRLYQLRYAHGDYLFLEGVNAAIKHKRYTIESIQYLINKHESDSNLSPTLSVTLPNRADVNTLEVTSHPLTSYDQI